MQNTKSSSISAGQPAAKAKNRSIRTADDAAKWKQPAHEQISKLACQLYIESGCQPGRDAENWLQAEKIVRAKAAGKTPASQPQSARK